MMRTNYATLSDVELLMIAYQKEDVDTLTVELATRLQTMLDVHGWDNEPEPITDGDMFDDTRS